MFLAESIDSIEAISPVKTVSQVKCKNRKVTTLNEHAPLFGTQYDKKGQKYIKRNLGKITISSEQPNILFCLTLRKHLTIVYISFQKKLNFTIIRKVKYNQ